MHCISLHNFFRLLLFGSIISTDKVPEGGPLMTWMSQFGLTNHKHGKMIRRSGAITLLEAA